MADNLNPCRNGVQCGCQYEWYTNRQSQNFQIRHTLWDTTTQGLSVPNPLDILGKPSKMCAVIQAIRQSDGLIYDNTTFFAGIAAAEYNTFLNKMVYNKTGAGTANFFQFIPNTSFFPDLAGLLYQQNLDRLLLAGAGQFCFVYVDFSMMYVPCTAA